MERSQSKDVWTAGVFYEPYVGRWSRLVAKELLRWLLLPVGKDWLDVGCGTGALTQIILGDGLPNSVMGIDPSEGFVAYAKAQIVAHGHLLRSEMLEHCRSIQRASTLWFLGLS
jgi:SAM-dependent methyltransferase